MDIDLTLRDSLDSLADAQGRLGAWLAATGLAQPICHRVELVFEELVTNVLKYAHGDGGQGHHVIAAAMGLTPAGIDLVVEDDGIAFDPRSHVTGPAADSLEDAAIGGMGLALVRRLTSRFDYLRSEDGRNRVAVRIPLQGQPSES